MPVLNHELDELFRRAATCYPEQPNKVTCWLQLASRLPSLGNSTDWVSLKWCLIDKPMPSTALRTGKDDETIR